VIKFRGPQGPWKPYFTWRPRRINGRWHWLTTIYRRERNIAVYPHQGYEFGTVADFIIDTLRNS
jgi:hypothetical protein